MFFKDRRVQFAIGLAVVLLAVKWLFTGSLLMAADAIDEGKTGSVTTAALPLVLDFVVGAMIAIGAWVVDLGGVLLGRIAGSAAASAPGGISGAAGVLIANDADAMRSNVIALGNAVAINEADSIEPLMTMIRQPFAIRELSEAYTSGDIERAERLNAELKKMHGAGAAPSTAVAGKRGAK